MNKYNCASHKFKTTAVCEVSPEWAEDAVARTPVIQTSVSIHVVTYHSA